MKNLTKINNISYTLLESGTFKNDGGTAFGILPRPIWQKFCTPDAYNRIELANRLLLIKDADKLILVDTGLGNQLDEKEVKFMSPSPWMLQTELAVYGIKNTDITHVVLTHLHFDHAGGIAHQGPSGLCLTFPQALHIIQKSEWEIAKHPDELNRAAYQYDKHLALLAKTGQVLLIEGDYALTSHITLLHTGGHSNGMQVVRLRDDNFLAYYAGDIIPSTHHFRLAVILAYDVCRRDTFLAKEFIINDLQKNGGCLLMQHDPHTAEYIFSQTKK